MLLIFSSRDVTNQAAWKSHSRLFINLIEPSSKTLLSWASAYSIRDLASMFKSSSSFVNLTNKNISITLVNEPSLLNELKNEPESDSLSMINELLRNVALAIHDRYNFKNTRARVSWVEVGSENSNRARTWCFFVWFGLFKSLYSNGSNMKKLWNWKLN